MQIFIRQGQIFGVFDLMRWKDNVLYKYHDELGHIGKDKMIEAIGKSYRFPNMKSKVSDHAQNCLKCIAYSPKVGKGDGYLHSIPKGIKPFEIIHRDHYGPVDNSRSKKHILAVVDAFTKFVRLYTTKTTNTKKAVNALTDYVLFQIAEAALLRQILLNL